MAALRQAQRPLSSRPGMRPFECRSQPFVCYVCVDLSRRQRRMAQDFLHTAEIGTTLQQMRRHRMPQSVGSEIGRPLGHSEGPMDDPAYHARVDPLAALADEHRLARLISAKPRTTA